MYYKMELKILFRSFILYVVQNMQYLQRKKFDLFIINFKEIFLNNFFLYDVYKCIKKGFYIKIEILKFVNFI